ncbi:hypothetical protein YPPY19_2165, partial [Yersinia pestis PY-19]
MGNDHPAHLADA